MNPAISVMITLHGPLKHGRDFLEVARLTDVGNVRQYNEDSIAVDLAHGILALADGMGGHRAGEVASRMATEMLLTRLPAAADAFRANGRQHAPLLALTQSINQANKSIYEAGRVDPRYRGMGTTLAAAMFHDNRVVLGHVGDSRIYRMRNGKLALLTRDDSLLRDQVELGVISAARSAAIAQPQPRDARARHRGARVRASSPTKPRCRATSTCCAPTGSTTASRTPTSSSS